MNKINGIVDLALVEERQANITRLDRKSDAITMKLADNYKYYEELKKEYIALNTFNMELDIDLYHVIKYEYLLNSLKYKCLYMKKTVKWDDVYEIFLLKNAAIEETSGEIIHFDKIIDRVYFQCWSTIEESNALWEIHSSNDFKSVKIKSRGSKLIHSLYDVNNTLHRSSYFIGRVNYFEREDILNFRKKFKISEGIVNGREGFPFIQSLFAKQKAYEYESEVRLIFSAPSANDQELNRNNPPFDYIKAINPWNISHDCFSYRIDINDVIDEITFHPKLCDCTCKKMAEEIRNTGYTGRISKSKLFTWDDSPGIF